MSDRTRVTIDRHLAEEARRVLGTRSLREAVEKTLSEAVRAELRRRLAERLAAPDGLDHEALGEVLRQRTRARGQP